MFLFFTVTISDTVSNRQETGSSIQSIKQALLNQTDTWRPARA